MTEKTAGYQQWKQLLFLHWRVTPDILQKCLPHELTPEVFDGSAWLGMVPFSMQRIRPWWSPPVPGISWFLETNLRTYVRHENGETGVWFFSLDANQRLAVAVARRFWHLNYCYADLQLTDRPPDIRYAGHRQNASYRADISLPESPQYRTADPDTLEHFLLERYLLFARSPDGSFYTGRVHHRPYTFTDVSIAHLSQTLTETIACGITDAATPDHIAYSPGVDVSVSPLRRISGNV